MERTTVGRSTEIEGDITGDDGLVVLGRVKGRVEVAREVVIERGGRVEADVDAENLQIAGELEGKVNAQTKVEITADGSAVGDIRAPRIVIADGAHYRGSVEMD